MRIRQYTRFRNYTKIKHESEAIFIKHDLSFCRENSVTLTKQAVNNDQNITESTLRRSKRQISKQMGISKYKSAMSFDSFIDDQCEDGLEWRDTGTIRGRGVFTLKKFFRGDYLVEYAGELLTQAEARQREHLYGRNHEIGCYMYYFRWGEKVFCVDATEETNRLGSYRVQRVLY